MATQPTDAKLLGDISVDKNSSPKPTKTIWARSKKSLKILKNAILTFLVMVLLLLHLIDDAWGEYTKVRDVSIADLAGGDEAILMVALIACATVWIADLRHLHALAKELMTCFRRL